MTARLLLAAALLAAISFAESNRRPFRSIKAPKGKSSGSHAGYKTLAAGYSWLCKLCYAMDNGAFLFYLQKQSSGMKR